MPGYPAGQAGTDGKAGAGGHLRSLGGLGKDGGAVQSMLRKWRGPEPSSVLPLMCCTGSL